MNEVIKEKIEQYIKFAKSQEANPDTGQYIPTRTDSLTQVIRSKKDADTFMAELDDIIKRAK